MFETGLFTLASGKTSTFKIECDDLTVADWETVAALVGPRYKFGAVEGVPTGGLPFADALKTYITPGAPLTLIVDDVFTTGGSMEKQRGERPRASERVGRHIHGTMPGDVHGVVLFARDFTPDWIDAVFTMALWNIGER